MDNTEHSCKYCGKPVDKNEKYRFFHEECYDKYDEFANEQDDMICPYCEYEFDDCDKEYEEGSMEYECPCCGKTFELETNFSYSWRTRKTIKAFMEEGSNPDE